MCRFALLVIAVTLLVGSMAEAASYQMTSGTIVDPILDTSGSMHPYSGNDLEPMASLINANLADANLDYVTFSPGTTLFDGQTVAQHGFDEAGLGAYLKAGPVSAWRASNLTIVSEPASVFLLLTGLLTLSRVRF